MSNTRRFTFSLSPQTSSDLCSASEQLGISRSSLVEQLLGPALLDLQKIISVGGLGASVSSGDSKRLRGESVRVIEDRFNEIRTQFNNLGSGV